MKIADTIKEAIARSISHNEIVGVIADPRYAVEAIETDENVTELDSAAENNRDLDVWGTRLGKEFRIRIILKK